jgi:hypothetical protein
VLVHSDDVSLPGTLFYWYLVYEYLLLFLVCLLVGTTHQITLILGLPPLWQSIRDVNDPPLIKDVVLSINFSGNPLIPRPQACSAKLSSLVLSSVFFPPLHDHYIAL